jgi:hypothetical protein
MPRALYRPACTIQLEAIECLLPRSVGLCFGPFATAALPATVGHKWTSEAHLQRCKDSEWKREKQN